MTEQSNFLTDDDMDLLARHGQVTRHAPGAILLNEATQNRRMFWMRKGRARVELERLFPGVTLATLGPGDMFGEISYLSDGRTTATVIAEDEVELLEVDRQALDALLQNDDSLAARFYHATAMALIQHLRI